MSLKPFFLISTLLLACGPKPGGDTTTDTSGDDPTSASGTSGTATAEPVTASITEPAEPTTGTTGTPGTTGTTGTPSPTTTLDPVTDGSPPDLGVEGPCDIWEENCPGGQKCMPVSLDGDSVWETTRCVPLVADPAVLGEPCQNLGTGLDGLDTCDLHMMCWFADPATGDGTCVGHCTGTPDEPGCADPGASCLISAEGVVNLCLPSCDPVEQTCPDGLACLPSFADGFVCVMEFSGEEGQAFDFCEFVNDCDPGLLCVASNLAPECDPALASCCLPFCDINAPNTCPGDALECLPFYSPGQAPPGLEHVGLCGAMQ